jgi:DNA recombination protein Rad52
MSFNQGQIKELSAKLLGKHVRTREKDGLTLSYIEGWHAIAEANRIFGFDGWDRETLSTTCVWKGRLAGREACSYVAQVRVRVRAGSTEIIREGSGMGNGFGAYPGEAHELALKEAETDAMKRALATFGNSFGLALYDKTKKGVTRSRRKTNGAAPIKWSVLSPRGRPVSTHEDPVAYCADIRKRLQDLETPPALKAFWNRNSDSVDRLRTALPDLKSEKGQHFADLLLTLFTTRLKELVENLPPAEPEPPAEKTPKTVDKSTLAIATPRIIRDKDHRRYVARQPCLVCGRLPSQAHHLRFAQPRAMGRKVSDEWTVPLCAIHHRAVHDAGDEISWWGERDIELLAEAERLWRQSHHESAPAPDENTEQETRAKAG